MRRPNLCNSNSARFFEAVEQARQLGLTLEEFLGWDEIKERPTMLWCPKLVEKKDE